MSIRIRVAVIGYGYWGARHARALAGLPGIDLTIVDTDVICRAEAAAGHRWARVADELDAVLDRVDAVIIASPPELHGLLTLRAVRAGKHVLVEAPMAASVEQARMLIDEAERHNAVLWVGHTFLYSPLVRALKAIVESGRLGRVLSLDAAGLCTRRYRSDGNALRDIAPQDVAILAYLLGEVPDRVSAWSHHGIGQRRRDVTHLRLGYENRADVVVRLTLPDPGPPTPAAIVGGRRTADAVHRGEGVRVYDTGFDPADPRTRAGMFLVPVAQGPDPLLAQDTHFLSCVRAGETADGSALAGVETVRLLAAADVALRSGADIRVSRPAAVSIRRNPTVSAI